MRRLLLAVPLLAIPLLLTAKVTRTSVVAMTESLDKQLAALFPEDPVMMISVPQGTYITGYGVVFAGELNLAPSAGISPFHQTISKEEVARIRAKEIDRVPKLKLAMQHMLVSSAASLDAVPPEEQVALAVSLFHFHWENVAGVPSQIVMHAPRKVLLALNGKLDKSVLSPSVTVEEF